MMEMYSVKYECGCELIHKDPLPRFCKLHDKCKIKNSYKIKDDNEQTRKNDCLNCQYQVDRPLAKCRLCAENDYNNWEPQTEVITNNNGGKQSKSEYLWTDFSPSALLRVAKLSKAGCEKYGIDNWKKISSVEHIDHAISHLVLHLNNDTTEDHLTHAAWRVLAAMGVNDGK